MRNINKSFRSEWLTSLKNELRIGLCLVLMLASVPMMAETRFIVRMQGTSTTQQSSGGLLGGLVGGLVNLVNDVLGLLLQNDCLLLNCHVQYNLDGKQGQVFLVTTATDQDPATYVRQLTAQPGVQSAEADLVESILAPASSSTYTVPGALYDTAPVNYYGTTVREGYVTQPAVGILQLPSAQQSFHVKGSGTIADIDTGVDPNHPVLKSVLVPGYDFTRNQAGIPDETSDLDQSTAAVINQSTAAVVNGSQPAYVNQSTAACVDQSTAAVVNGPQYAAFGHGTMVSGILHLAAPGAHIMPLKAFHADGTGYTSDILRAIYFAVDNNAKVLNMSFSFASYSNELNMAIQYANQHGVISVASVGNNGQATLVYPAALPNVMGVASTSNNDTRSAFSNYGPGLVFVAAPGEGIVTTYPFGAYAAGWGTSFSTPFVSGTVALLLDLEANQNESAASTAISHAKFISLGMGYGRMDIYQAVNSERNSGGLLGGLLGGL